MKRKMMMLCLALVSGGAFAQHEHPKSDGDMKMEKSMVIFKDVELGKAYENYIQLKDALVASNKEEAKNRAVELKQSLVGVEDSKMVVDETAKVISAASIEEQRKAFSGLSDMMAMLVKDGKLSKGMIYLDYCPMAKSSWLSNEKEIKNPYFGAQMLSCGNVKEMIH